MEGESMTEGKPLTAKLWDLMDNATERFMGIPKDQRDTPEALKAAGEARGLADALTVMCSPYLDEKNAAAKLAIKRLKAKQSDEEMPSTPGYMSSAEARDAARQRNEKARAEAKAKAGEVQSERGAAVVPKSSGELSDAEKQSITNLGPTKVAQIKNGISLDFGHQKLADLYDVTTNVIVALEREMDGK